MADVPVTLTLTADEHAAVEFSASRYQVTVEEQLQRWLHGPIRAAEQERRATIWDRRRRVLETDTQLAATVDDAATRTR